MVIIIVYLAIGAYLCESVNIYADKKGIRLGWKDWLYLWFLWPVLVLMSALRMIGKSGNERS